MKKKVKVMVIRSLRKAGVLRRETPHLLISDVPQFSGAFPATLKDTCGKAFFHQLTYPVL